MSLYKYSNISLPCFSAVCILMYLHCITIYYVHIRAYVYEEMHTRRFFFFFLLAKCPVQLPCFLSPVHSFSRLPPGDPSTRPPQESITHLKLIKMH